VTRLPTPGAPPTTINGSVHRFADEVHALTLAVQRLSDQADDAAERVVVTASALKAAEDARRSRSESSWSPLSRTATAMGALVALATLLSLAYLRG